MNTSQDLFVQIRAKECVSAAKALLLRVYPNKIVSKQDLDQMLQKLSEWERELYLEVTERDNTG